MADVGRPTSYTPELADIICERILTRPLHRVAKDEDLPCEATIYNWLVKYPEFLEKYARIRPMRAYRRAEQVDEVIEELRAGDIDYNVAKVHIDAIKWQAGRENPLAFGDSAHVNMKHSGEVGFSLTIHDQPETDDCD